MNYKSYGDLADDIKRHLPTIHAGQYDLVVGIPRSGMIPAYMVGLYLNANVIDIQGFVKNAPLKKGLTRKAKKVLLQAHDAQRVLIVDDSIQSGNSLREVIESLPEELKAKVTTLAIYSDRARRSDVDIFLEVVEWPRAFEWNIFHRDLMQTACVDLDTVICDSQSIAAPNSKEYAQSLLNAKPMFTPSYKIHSLITARSEKVRSQTEMWLAQSGIQYERLVFIGAPEGTCEKSMDELAAKKAEYYHSQKALDVFFEYDALQARKIMALTKKPVFSIESNQMFTPHSLSSAMKNPRQHIARSIEKFKLSSNLAASLKSLKKFLKPPMLKS